MGDVKRCGKVCWGVGISEWCVGKVRGNGRCEEVWGDMGECMR